MKFWEPKTLLILLSLAVLTACQPSSSGSGKKTGKKNNTQIPIDEIKDQFALLGDPKETAFQDRKYSFTSTAVSPFKDGTFKLEDAPSWLSVDSTTGEVSGTPNDVLSAFIYKLIFEASVQAEAVGTYPLTVFGNPLKKYQWHLTNTGQKTFSANAGTAGEDINMSKTVNSGITGLGVKIAISDTAAEMNHEALVLNAIQNASRDYTLSYPYNTSLFAKLLDRDSSTGKKPEHHATAVSGIAVGRGWNNVGIRGVAPFAKFAVFNYVAWNVTQTTEKSLDQLQGNFDVFNQSWGVSARYSLEYDWDYDNFLFDQIKKGRDGKGPVYVRAGGNGFDVDSDSSVFASQAVGSDPYNATPYVIVVGALNAKGERASYSSIGSALWISAPGGEFGDDDPAMLTADLSGCSEGKSKTTATFNSFDKGIAPENPGCNYTSAFNGTSAAAPVVSGIVALMLEANPNLSWRDVKYILAKTATQIDPTFDRVDLTNGYIYEPGWVTNKAGFKFHNWYGFGRVNVDDAVEMAKNYNIDLGIYKETRDYDSATGQYIWRWKTPSIVSNIPDNDINGTNTPGIFVQDNYTIEAVQIEIDVTHTYPADLAVELTSPEGTKSILLPALNSYTGMSDLPDLVLLSNAFYGEKSRGNWQIKLIDVASGDSGTLNRWKINIVGH